MKGPLSGLQVLDLTHARAGPSAVRLLSDWGASVIKIEPPSNDADSLTGHRRTPDEENLHRNKRSITLNLKHAIGHEIFLKMVRQADILVENFRAPVKDRLKISYDDLKVHNPRLIYASISGFGQTGPYADRGGVDQIVQGMSGLMSITGEPGGTPMRVGIAISDTSAGHFLGQGILLALLHRERSGEGQWVQTSLLEAMLNQLDFQAARYTVDGEVPKPQGNDHPTLGPMGTFESADGLVNIAAPTERFWALLAKVLGAEQWLENPDYASSLLRRQNLAQLKADINQQTRKHTTAWLIERLNSSGLPCGPVNTVGQAFEDPQVQHLAMAQPSPHPERGTIHLVRTPINLSAFPEGGRFERSAPLPGQDTDDVLADLGLDAEAIATLRGAGII